ncbi:hypothetical protein RQM47_02295 [Rubrivirga sp. S365]|uniref:Uncharacterized protein n=1 Tax=Rubrivirga litoralis TaxID=3075598 RepID=A0ABU3BQL3_9BACT|nr:MULTISPECIES: hypothetical protein [unclassified Rubrivirga]MDT0631550.1 hypothetical protein [Rubrivirga sp. F394]MDT7855467.1 hypothetical protein [Rubrivirga sp. S365]
MSQIPLLGRSLRPALALALVTALAGCYSARPALVERDRGPAPVVPDTAEAGPARVGLAATMDVPQNPYGDTAAVALPDAGELPSLNAIDGRADGSDDAYAEGGAVDPSAVSVTRYYYDDAGTYYYDDVEADLADGGLGVDDDFYYGGYYADYYRYGDPSYYPSLYTYYRPYRVYNPYRRFGWYNTWGRRYGAFGHSPYYAYDPFFSYGGVYDPFFYDPFFYGPGVHVSVGFGFGGFGYGGYGYGHNPYFAGAGYYGPGYYGRPRHHNYYTYRERRGADDGVRSPVRGMPGTPSSPIVESTPNPARVPARMPVRRGLNPARISGDPAPNATRAPVRAGRGGADPVADAPGRRTPPRATAPRTPRRGEPGTTGRVLPGRAAPTRATPARTAPPDREWARPERAPRVPRRARSEDARVREAAPRPERRPRPEARPVPRRETRPAPPPRRETRPAPRRETRPAPPPRRQTRSAPPPRRESRPAPAPRRQESRPARSSGGGRSTGGSSRRSSRRGGNG